MSGPTPGDAKDDWRDEGGRWHYADCGACRPSGCCCFCPVDREDES